MVTATRTAGSRKMHWFLRLVIIVACALGFLFVAAIAILNFGAVQGIEFSPDTFASRVFVYYEIPLIRARITPVWRDDVSGTLQKRIGVPDKLVPASSTATPRWHLVVMRKGSNSYHDDALIIYRYIHENHDLMVALMFGLADDSDAAERWRKWTNDHDELAAILWPAVAQACRAELYLFTPELFEIAEQMTLPEGTAPSREEFESAIAEAMARQYTALADARRGRGKHDEAIELYSAALKYDGDFRAALAGREQAYYSAGESEKSKQDRDRLSELERGN